MKFTIALLSDANHEKYCHMLYYPIRLLTAGLVDLGHDVLVTHNSVSTEEEGRFNLLVGAHHFTMQHDIDQLLGMLGPYAVVQTEWIADGVLHGRSTKKQFEETYLRLLKGAAVVWEMGDKRNNVPGLDTVQLRAGYHETLVDIRHRPWEQKDIDCVFFGSVTSYRRDVLNACAARGLKVAVLGIEHSPIRNDALARSKVVLAPLYGDGLTYAGEFRICYARTNGFAVVQDIGEGADVFAESVLNRVHAMNKSRGYQCGPDSEPFVDKLAVALQESETFMAGGGGS